MVSSISTKRGDDGNPMDSLRLLMFLCLVLSAFLFYASYAPPEMLTGHVSREFQHGARSIIIDQKVDEAMAEHGEAEVMIFFEDMALGRDRANLAERRTKADELASVAASRFGKDRIHRVSAPSGMVSMRITQEELEELTSDFSIRRISYNMPVRPLLDDSVPLTGADDAWALDVPGIDMTGEGKAVCVVDTGVDYTHPAFGGCTYEEFKEGDCRVIAGYDVADNNDDPMDGGEGGHGTHVAGIVASAGNPEGMAPGADIIAIKVFPDGEDNTHTSVVIEGIDYCVSLSEDYDIVAMTLSLGSSLQEDYCDNEFIGYSESIGAAIDAGISVVVAAGNDGSYDEISVPACIEGATRVASTDKSDLIASSSNRNTLVNLTAPGVGIEAPVPGGYGTKSGTSMAVPHVAGAIALMELYLSYESRSLSPKELENVLYRTGIPIDDEENSGSNFSRIHVLNALGYLDTTPPHLNISTDQEDSFHYSEGINISWQSSDIFGVARANFTVYYPDSSQLYMSDASQGGLALYPENLSQGGEYTIALLAEDVNGNLADHSITFNVTDVPQPNITLLLDGSPGDAYLNDSGIVNITAHAEIAELDLELFINGILAQVGDPNIYHTHSFDTPGLYEILVRHNSTEELFHEEIVKHVRVYNTTPHINAWHPEEDSLSVMRDETLLFNLSAKDEQGLPLSYTWLVQGSEVSTESTMLFDGLEHGLGSHEIKVIADNGLKNNSQSWNLTSEPLPLLLDIISPENTSYAKTELDMEISHAANPDIDACWYVLGDGNATLLEDCDTTVLGPLDDGEHTLEAYANNTLGDEVSNETIFIIDTTPPVLHLDIPDEGLIPRTQEFVAEASPGPSGLYSLSYDAGEGLHSMVPGEPQAPFENLTETSNVSLMFRAEDNAGNTNTSEQSWYLVDLSPPDISQVSEMPEKVNGTHNMTFQVSDPLGNNLSLVSYRINERDAVILNSSIESPEYELSHDFSFSTGLNDLYVMANDTFGNQAILELEVESRGELNLSVQKSELKSSLEGYEISFRDAEGNELSDSGHSDDFVGISVTLDGSDTSLNLSGIDPTRVRWENKSFSISTEDDNISSMLSTAVDYVSAMLRTHNFTKVFRDGSFESSIIVFPIDASEIDYVFRFPEPDNTSIFHNIGACDTANPQLSDMPCRSSEGQLRIFTTEFSAYTAGTDTTPPEVHLDEIPDFPDWRFNPRIIVSNDVLDMDDVIMTYEHADGDDIETAEDLEAYNQTHRLATFPEMVAQHGEQLNLSFDVTDAAGNTNSTEWKNLTINDTEPPEISLDIEDEHVTSQDSLTLTVELNKPGTVRYTDDSGSDDVCFEEEEQGTCDIPLVSGDNLIDIDAENLAGVSSVVFLTVTREEDEEEEEEDDLLLDLPDEDDDLDEDIDDDDEGDEGDEGDIDDKSDEDAHVTMEELPDEHEEPEVDDADDEMIDTGDVLVLLFSTYKEMIFLSLASFIILLLLLTFFLRKRRKKAKGLTSSLAGTKIEPLMDDYAPEERSAWESRKTRSPDPSLSRSSSRKKSGKKGAGKKDSKKSTGKKSPGKKNDSKSAGSGRR